MKELLTFEGLPMLFIIALVVVSYLSLFSVIFAA